MQPRAPAIRGGGVGDESETRPRLLVADDDELYLQTLEAALGTLGFDVELATSGEEAVERLQRRESEGASRLDCVLLDRMMPGIGGERACELIRAQSAHPDVPIIIVTAWDERDAAVGALSAGADDYVLKGSAIEVLAARVRVQIRRGRQHHALTSAIDVMSAVLASVPDPIFAVGAAGRISLMNAPAERLSGGASLGEHIAAWSERIGLAPMPHAGAPGELPTLRALRGESVDAVEMLARAPNGDERWLLASARPLRDPSGERLGAVTVLRDVTAERSAQQQLFVADRMATLGFLAASVSHEINNPLAAVSMNLDAVLPVLQGHPSRDVVEAVRDIRGGVDRIRSVAKDLRVFTRERSAPLEASADVNHVIESSIRLAWTEIRHKARLERHLGTVPRVRGTENRLGQVVLNLVLNAAQAIPAGHADEHRIAVSSEADEAREHVIVTVTDTGTGIAPSDLPQIFSALFTTKASGTGLGLSICERIVRDMGGRIEVESTVGRGSTFRVVIPVAQATPAPEHPAGAPAAAAVPRRRVAVVDDEPALLRALARILERKHTVRTFASADGALQSIEAGDRYDVILCDVMMPVVTGLELHRRLAERDPDLASRVVFLTGGSANPSLRAALAALPNRRLEKPCDTERLLEAIAETPKLDAS